MFCFHWFCCSSCFFQLLFLLLLLFFSVMVFVIHNLCIFVQFQYFWDWDTVCARRVSTLILLPTSCCYNSEPNDFATIVFDGIGHSLCARPLHHYNVCACVVVFIYSLFAFTHIRMPTLSHTVITWFRQWCMRMYNNFQLRRLLVYVLSSPASLIHAQNPGSNGNTKPVQ